MTTQYVISSTVSGQTGLVAKLFAINGDTVLYTADTVEERANALGDYLATYGEVVVIPSGDYVQILFSSGGLPLARSERTFAGTDGETATARHAELATATQTQIDNLVDGVSQFTASSLDILTAVNGLTATQLAAITVESGVIGNFPETLTIGDSYSTDTGRIKISITDSEGDPITGLGTLEFADAAISFTFFRPNDSVELSGTCEFVDATTSTYVWLTIPSSVTAQGKAEYTYEGRLKFFWEGPSSGTSDDEQKTYKTTPFKFISNP